jgi:hypothetical protein
VEILETLLEPPEPEEEEDILTNVMMQRRA